MSSPAMKVWAPAAVLVAIGLGFAGQARANTTKQYAYRGDWCRFGSWSTCGATGECATPSQITHNGWTLDHQKLQPKSQTTSTGYPVEFVCPLIRVFKAGANAPSWSPLNVQVAGSSVVGAPMDCTLYSLTKYGATTQSKNFQVTAASSPTSFVKTLKLTKTSADGSFSLSCKLPIHLSDSTAAILNQYRSEETSDSTDTKWRTYPSSRCVILGEGFMQKIRYTYNKATNVDTASRDFSCPTHDIEGVSGTTPAYTATIYLNEAKAAGGSKCRLVARDHFGTSIKQSTVYVTTSSSGDKTLSTAYLPAEFSDYNLRYSVDCTLTAGSSVYSYVMGK